MALPHPHLAHPDKLFIGGQWVTPSTANTFAIVHPGTEEVAMRVAEAREADIDRAVAAARDAFDNGPWPRLAVAERVRYLRALAEQLDQRLDDLAIAHTLQIGVPISMSRATVPTIPADARAFADYADNYKFEEVRAAQGGHALVTREPIGVVAAIVPWNLPGHLGMIKMCPALLAGCTVVVKPSPEAPLDSLIIAECAEKIGLPEGVLSILPAGREVGDRLIRDLRVDKVSFTGSTAAGKHIGAVCMERVARVSLELGGKSAAIVMDDAPLAHVIPALVGMSTLLNGQACMALTRVLVSKARKPELVAALGAAYAALKVGDPFDPATRIGPLATAVQRERVERYIDSGVNEGARVVTGGKRPEHLTQGYFVEPTVFTNVDNRMKIAQEEIFGPVISIIEYENEDHAVAIANDSLYGLSGAIFTADAKRALALARRIRSGTVAHNAMGPQACLPFGGYKQSGIGREGSPEGIDLYTEIKTIYLNGPAA
ncbi:MAG: aldehyde dehydrogenase [Steroidobacteraceae bacterium]